MEAIDGFASFSSRCLQNSSCALCFDGPPSACRDMCTYGAHKDGGKSACPLQAPCEGSGRPCELLPVPPPPPITQPTHCGLRNPLNSRVPTCFRTPQTHVAARWPAGPPTLRCHCYAAPPFPAPDRAERPLDRSQGSRVVTAGQLHAWNRWKWNCRPAARELGRAAHSTLLLTAATLRSNSGNGIAVQIVGWHHDCIAIG